MLTVNGQKMSKSLGNSFLPRELFNGSHPLLEKGFGPMTVRFFMLQSHYSSTLDFSNEALTAAEKGFKKLSNALLLAKKLHHPGDIGNPTRLDETLTGLIEDLHKTMCDDFNTAKTLATLFDMAGRIYDFKSGNTPLSETTPETFERFKTAYITFMENVLGLTAEEEQHRELLDGVINVLIDLRKKARQDKNYKLSDKIRDDLKAMGVQLMDGKNGEMSYAID
jgi:cysteinyl-tRNA synthetase